jgi:hypothetical protein
MSSLIPLAGWDNYKALMRRAHDTFNQDTLTWLKANDAVTRFMEQEDLNPTIIPLKVLLGFNSFRTWPITLQQQGGEIDNQNMIAFINKTYLQENGWLLPNGYFNFRPDKDYFMHRGIKYKAEGDTFASQAYDDPLHIILVLRREELLVGETQFDQQTSQRVIVEVDYEEVNLISYDVL